MKEKSKKIMILSVLAALAVAGITLALLTSRTRQMRNQFTVLGSRDIDVSIDEPSWEDGDGDDAIPGKVIDKDPFMKNESSEMDIYVAIQLIFVKGNQEEFDLESDRDRIMSSTEYAKLMEHFYLMYDPSGVHNLNTDGDGKTGVWLETTETGNGAVFVWHTSLVPQESTGEIFKQVMFSKQADKEYLDWIIGTYDEVDGTLTDGLGQFDIIIRGAAVQAENVTISEAKQELVNMLKLD